MTSLKSNTRHLTQCAARFDGTRSHAAVEEFITAANIFKDMEGISDQAAIAGLPLLLTAEANQWWNGVKSTIESWKHAIELIRKAFAPRRANHRLFLEIQGDCEIHAKKMGNSAQYDYVTG